MSYAELFGKEANNLLIFTLKNEDFQGCFLSLGEACLSKLKSNNQVQIEEALQLKEAFLALDAMCKFLKISSPILHISDNQPSRFHQIGLEIARVIQNLKRKSSCQKQNFKEAFNETDGMVLVGRILIDLQNQTITQFCKKAFEMGLCEGLDFRGIGIDYDIKDVCNLIDGLVTDEQENLGQQLKQEIERKKAFLQGKQQVGFLKDISVPNENASHPELIQWEASFNKALLLLVLTQEKPKSGDKK